MIEPIVLNTEFERLAVIDYYSSLIWTERYYECGDFEICVPVNNTNMELFKVGYYLIRDDADSVGIIEKIRIEKTEDNMHLLIVSGRFLASILNRRIISQQTQVSGTISKAIETLLDNEAISPDINSRKINNLVFNSSVTSLTTMQAQYTGKNLLETIADICLTYGLGFKIVLTENDEFNFVLYEGLDRSYDQNALPYVVFSDEYDNLISNEYEEDYTNMITDVLVAGEGEGLERRTVWVSDESNSGLNRYEYYDDRRDLQSNDGEISDADYLAQLKQAGKECITKYTVGFDGVVFFDNVKYRTDVNIGDICTIENKRWGLYINSRIIEVIESVNEAGEYSIIPTFGI